MEAFRCFGIELLPPLPFEYSMPLCFAPIGILTNFGKVLKLPTGSPLATDTCKLTTYGVQIT